jgi:hypothetical protein
VAHDVMLSVGSHADFFRPSRECRCDTLEARELRTTKLE